MEITTRNLDQSRRKWLDDPLWSDGWWQLRKRIRTADHLREWINLTDDELGALEATKAYFRWQLTPYYASLMDPDDANCPIRRQIVPLMEELEDDIPLMDLDPLEELAHSPVKNVIHNYKDRVAFCVAADCAAYCRYCLRKRMVSDGAFALNRAEIQEGIDYLASNSDIKDVLLTGGDPLTLDDRDLEWIISSLRAIPHIEIIRVGTRFPVLNPFRVDEKLVDILKRHHPIWLNTHFNHAKELSSEAVACLQRLADAGIPVGNQTVLLKGINDDAEILRTLFRKLVQQRVRPYYLYHAQLIGGTRHFRTSIERGMKIMEELRGTLSGFAIPLYVLDTPYGKVPLTPDGYVEREGDYVSVMSYQGKVWKEYNPSEIKS